MLTVLTDNNVLTSIKELIVERHPPIYFRKSSLAQLIELLVLSEEIKVDEMSFSISKIGDFLSFLNPELTKIISGINITSDDRGNAVSFAHNITNSVSYNFDDKHDEYNMLRGFFYLYLANQNDLPYFPIEQRTFFLSSLESTSDNIPAFRKILEIYEKRRHSAFEELSAKGLVKNRFQRLPYPPIFYHALGRASNLPQLFDIALDLRESKNARYFRKWCAELTDAERNDDYISVGKMFREVESYIQKICEPDSDGYKVELQVSFPPSITFTEIAPFFKRKRHLLFLKQMLSDNSYSRLDGKFNDLLMLS